MYVTAVIAQNPPKNGPIAFFAVSPYKEFVLVVLYGIVNGTINNYKLSNKK